MSYGDSYKNWKDWEDNSFGNLSRQDKTYYDAELKGIRSNFEGKKLNVLEIGYGNGSFLTYCKNKDWDICGLELNEELHKIALELGYQSKISTNLGDLPSSSFDIVVAFDVIEHQDREELSDFFRETHELLRPGGYFISRFPNGDSPFSLLVQNGDLTHKTFIGSESLRYLAIENNYLIEELRGSAEPIIAGSFVHFFHRLLSKPIKIFINLLLSSVYYPGRRKDLSSICLTAILRKPD